MIIYVDIDDTICKTPKGLDYSKAIPMLERIEKINHLYEHGNNITYWTARGTVTGIDWEETTRKQLAKWGAKYHNLKFGKPAYDLFVDDKNISTEHFFKKTIEDRSHKT